MPRLIRYILAFVVLLVMVLLFTQPNERHFLDRIAADYGQVHGGIKMNAKMLVEMGECEYESHFLYSTYHYRFGTIGVAYVGIGGQVFFVGSTNHQTPSGSSVDVRA